MVNTIEPLPKKNGPDPKLSPQHRIRLREAVEQQPDLTVVELKHKLKSPHGNRAEGFKVMPPVFAGAAGFRSAA